MTAEEMVLQHWGFDSTTNPFDLSQTMQYELKAAVKLMHLWEEHKIKKVKADAAVYELLIASREQMIVSRDEDIETLKERIGTLVDQNIRLNNQIDRLKESQYDHTKSCSCETSIGQTWCCNQCGRPYSTLREVNNI